CTPLGARRRYHLGHLVGRCGRRRRSPRASAGERREDDRHHPSRLGRTLPQLDSLRGRLRRTRSTIMNHAAALRLSAPRMSRADEWELEHVIEGLIAANADLQPRRHGRWGKQGLPSRDAIKHILADLRTILFPVHFGAPDPSARVVRSYIGE